MTQYDARITMPGVFPVTCLECGTVLLDGDKCDHFDGTGSSLSMRMGAVEAETIEHGPVDTEEDARREAVKRLDEADDA